MILQQSFTPHNFGQTKSSIEILVAGPNVIMGYYKDESSAQVALKDGWLHIFKTASKTVLNYLPICTSSTLISDGLTPLIRLAWPNVRGRRRDSFSRDSALSELIRE